MSEHRAVAGHTPSNAASITRTFPSRQTLTTLLLWCLRCRTPLWQPSPIPPRVSPTGAQKPRRWLLRRRSSGSELEQPSSAFNGTQGVRKRPVGGSSSSTASRTSRNIDDGPIRSSILFVRNWSRGRWSRSPRSSTEPPRRFATCSGETT